MMLFLRGKTVKNGFNKGFFKIKTRRSAISFNAFVIVSLQILFVEPDKIM